MGKDSQNLHLVTQALATFAWMEAMKTARENLIQFAQKANQYYHDGTRQVGKLPILGEDVFFCLTKESDEWYDRDPSWWNEIGQPKKEPAELRLKKTMLQTMIRKVKELGNGHDLRSVVQTVTGDNWSIALKTQKELFKDLAKTDGKYTEEEGMSKGCFSFEGDEVFFLFGHDQDQWCFTRPDWWDLPQERKVVKKGGMELAPITYRSAELTWEVYGAFGGDGAESFAKMKAQVMGLEAVHVDNIPLGLFRVLQTKFSLDENGMKDGEVLSWWVVQKC